MLLQLSEALWIRTWAPQLAFVLVGTLLVGVGNLLPTTIPPHPWAFERLDTLRSRPFWIEVNRVGGYVTVALGVVMIVAAVVPSHSLAGQATLVAILAAVGILVARYRRLVRDFEQR